MEASTGRGDGAGPALLAGACAFLSFCAYYPGFMSPDSIRQLGEASAGVYGDANPPVMAALWRVLLWFADGPVLMLLLQVGLWWGCLLGLARQVFPGRRAAQCGVLLGVGLWPPLIASLGTIWRDVHVAVALLLACVLLGGRGGWGRNLGAAGAIVYAAGVRHNGAAAALALAVLLGWRLAAGVPGRAGRGLAAVALGFGLVLAGPLLDRALTSRAEYPAQILFFYDLAGISVGCGQCLVPAELLPPGAGLATLKEWYSPLTAAWILAGPVPGQEYWVARMPSVATPAANARLIEAWWAAVRAHPGEYLAHRRAVFAAHLGWSTSEPFYPFHTGITTNPLGWSWKPTPFATQALAARQRVLELVPWTYAGWVYLLGLGLGLAGLAARGRLASLPGAVFASGLVYAGSGALVAVAADCRYHLWAITALWVGGLLLLRED